MNIDLIEKEIKNLLLNEHLDRALFTKISKKYGPGVFNSSQTIKLSELIADIQSQKQLLKIISKVDPLLKNISIDFKQLNDLKLSKSIHKSSLIYLIIKFKYYKSNESLKDGKISIKKFSDKILSEDKELLKRLS